MNFKIKNHLLIAALTLTTSHITFADVVVNDGLGVDLELPLSYKGTGKASQFAVTNHLNVLHTNKIFERNGIDVKIWSGEVVFFDYDSNQSVPDVRFNGVNDVYNSGSEYYGDKSYFVVRIADGEKGGALGAASVPKRDVRPPIDDPDKADPYTSIIALNTTTIYGGKDSSNLNGTFPHELSHALGAEHENTKYEPIHDAPYSGATSVSVCMDGSEPLMVALTEVGSNLNGEYLPWISGTDNCPVLGDSRMGGNAPVIQQYYNSTQAPYYTKEEFKKYNPSARPPSTLKATVLENVNNRQFDFKLSREQTNATTGTLFIAGNGIGLTPIEFSFADGENEKTISVDFDEIHNLLEVSAQNLMNGQDYTDTVYGVVQTEGEVAKGLIDISDVNTQYTPTPKDGDDNGGGGGNNNDNANGGGSGGGGGGSSSFGFLTMLLGLAWWRKRS